MNLLLAEWTKLRSTASFWWTTGVTLVGSVGLAILLTVLLPEEAGPFLNADLAITGFQSFGFIAIMVQAIMVVTSEYRFGIPTMNFLAAPRRWTVAVAKVVLYSVLAAVITFISLALSYLAVKLLLPADAAEFFTPFSDDRGQRYLWVLPVTMVVTTFFVQGLGWLIRHTAGAITLSLMWLFVFEAIIGVLPRIGEEVIKYLPFQNMNAFMADNPVRGTEWDPLVSLGIYALWALVLWIAGVVSVKTRDA